MDLVYNAVNGVTKELAGRDKHAGGKQEQSGHFAVKLKYHVGRPDFGETCIGFHRTQNIANKLEAHSHLESQHFLRNIFTN